MYRVAGFRIGVAIAVVVAAGGTVLARPSTLELTCQGARHLVAAHGALVMTTGPGTYERIMANYGQCLAGETSRTFVAPTLDDPRCLVGYYCAPVEGRPK